MGFSQTDPEDDVFLVAKVDRWHKGREMENKGSIPGSRIRTKRHCGALSVCFGSC